MRIQFLILPAEGRSYETSGTICEAQNKAAASGTCTLNTLDDLDELDHGV